MAPKTVSQVLNTYGKSILPEEAGNIPGWHTKVIDATDEASVIPQFLTKKAIQPTDLKFRASGTAWKASSLYRAFSTCDLSFSF